MRIVAIEHLTLDGVMQGPGRADEDTRDGFSRGGWSPPFGDQVMGEAMGKRLGASGGLLLGRRTYEDVLAHWNANPDPVFTDALNGADKHVASTTLQEPLPWPNSTLLEGDVPAAVTKLKERDADDAHVLGSGAFLQSLLPHGLVDEWMLMIHPIVLGEGRRLFPDGGVPTILELVEATPTTTGVVIATYRPAVAPDPA